MDDKKRIRVSVHTSLSYIRGIEHSDANYKTERMELYMNSNLTLFARCNSFNKINIVGSKTLASRDSNRIEKLCISME